MVDYAIEEGAGVPLATDMSSVLRDEDHPDQVGAPRGRVRQVRCISISIYKTRSRKAILMSLALLCVIIGIGMLGVWTRSFSVRAIDYMIGELAALALIMSLAILGVFAVDVVRDEGPRRRAYELGGRKRLSAVERLELKVIELALRGVRHLPPRLRPEAGEDPLDAVILENAPRKPLPPLLSSSIPFEPFPLGRDPERGRVLLEHLASAPGEEEQGVARPPSAWNQRRRWYRGLSVTQRVLLTIATSSLLSWWLYTGDLVSSSVLGAFWAALLAYHYWHAESPSAWLFQALSPCAGVPGGGRATTFFARATASCGTMAPINCCTCRNRAAVTTGCRAARETACLPPGPGSILRLHPIVSILKMWPDGWARELRSIEGRRREPLLPAAILDTLDCQSGLPAGSTPDGGEVESAGIGASFSIDQGLPQRVNPLLVLFQQAKRRADNFARDAVASRLDLTVDEGVEVVAEGDAGVPGHGELQRR